MDTNLTQSEIELMEFFHDPTALTENLFPVNFDAPYIWTVETPCITVRPYQMPMQNYSSMYADDPELSGEENFLIKKGAGDGYHIAARGLGKSWWLIIDTCLSIIYNIGQGLVGSDCAKHLEKVTIPITQYAESHPFLKVFHLKQSRAESVKRNPLTITTQNGTIINSANENADSKNPGEQFHGPHPKIFYFEEFSYTTDEGQKKAIDTRSSYGRIERFSGIPDVSLGSPLGKILKNPKLKNWIWRLPQLVKEEWSGKMEQDLAELHGGKNSSSYKLNVMAETIEGAFGFFDMARLQEASLNKSRQIKHFEISKEQFNGFEDRLIVEKLPGTITTFIAADIGTGAAPTEIIVIFYDGKKYHCVYNITLYRLIQNEQAKVFKFLYDKLGGAFVAVDATHDNGVIIDELYETGVPQDNLLKVKFNENIEVGFEKTTDPNGNESVVLDKEGNPVPKLVHTELHSFKELENLLYGGNVDVWYDEKFINQFTDIIAKQSGMRLIFDTKGINHETQAWQVWAICRFVNEYNQVKNSYKSQNKRGWCA